MSAASVAANIKKTARPERCTPPACAQICILPQITVKISSLREALGFLILKRKQNGTAKKMYLWFSAHKFVPILFWGGFLQSTNFKFHE
jgi:hypothetical protein